MGKVLAIAIAALLFGAGFYASQHQPPKLLKLHELSIVLPLNNRTFDYAYRTETVQGVGTVVFVGSPKLAPLSERCDLGVFYRLKKIGFEQYKTAWTIGKLQLAAQGGDTPPQVKELDDSYLVFEPSQAVCSSDPASEVELRSGLLYAVSGAERTGPAK